MNVPWTLIDDYLEQSLSPEGMVQLEEWLAASREHRRIFIRATQDHATIPLALGKPKAERAEAGQRTAIFPRRLFLPIAAGLAVLVGLVFLASPRATADHLLVMQVEGEAVATNRSGAISRVSEGAPVPEGTMVQVAARSHLSLGYAGEKTRIGVGENSSFFIPAGERGKRIRFFKGAADFAVEKQPLWRPMTIETPQGELRVPGTKLRLFTTPKSTRVRVAEGTVRLTGLKNANSVSIAGGTQATLGSDRSVRTMPARMAAPFVPTEIPSATSAAPVCPTGSLTNAPEGGGAILREVWFGITGTNVHDLTTRPEYPAMPSYRDFPTCFETREGGAAHDFYGERWRGFLVAPVTGEYSFWVAADDSAELYLSPDDRPERKALAASVPAYTFAHEWAKYREQESEAIHLEAGRRYYIEALHKEQAGGDHIAVAWQPPGGEPQIIEGKHLWPFIP